MLIFWNMAGVPFTYCYNTLYLLKQYEAGHPVYLSWAANATLCVVLLSAYYGQCFFASKMRAGAEIANQQRFTQQSCGENCSADSWCSVLSCIFFCFSSVGLRSSSEESLPSSSS